jgi:hypothetical protein
MALVRTSEHGNNAILIDCERNAKASLFEQRCVADNWTKLLRRDIAGYAPGYLRQASAVTSGENDCVSGLILLVEFHGKLLASFACNSVPLTVLSGGLVTTHGTER